MRSIEIRGPKNTDPVNARDSLIREQLRFLLHRDEAHFSKEFLAQLLDEGCNLPLALAKPVFYRAMVTALSSELDPALKDKLTADIPPDPSRIRHREFHTMVQSFCTRVSNPEEQLAMASINAISVVCERWVLNRELLTGSAVSFDEYLRGAVEEIAEENPGGQMAGLQFDRIRRRVYMALIASLLRHAGNPVAFKSAFGSVPQALAAMQEDHAVFCKAMELLSAQVPYFADVASRTFWRTLNAMDTDY